MLIEAARRAEAAAKEMLALVNEGSVPCAEIREALEVSKAIAGVNSAFQAAGAASVAGRERHGDGGAEVLASSAGLSRQEAHSQVRTAEALRQAPRLRDADALARHCVELHGARPVPLFAPDQCDDIGGRANRRANPAHANEAGAIMPWLGRPGSAAKVNGNTAAARGAGALGQAE